jgi:hypothetical protein
VGKVSARLGFARALWYNTGQRMNHGSHTSVAPAAGYSYVRFFAWRFS